MRVLVTGAGGFVGAYIVAAGVAQRRVVLAAQRGPLVAVPGATGPPEPPAGGQAATWVVCDVTDAAAVERVFADHQPTHVVHAAAITPDSRLETEQSRRVVETNEFGTLAVLRAAADHGVKRLVFLSSSAVYAPADPSARLAEDAPLCDSCSLYAVTKLGAERLCHWARDRFDLDTRVVRLGSVYGAFERPTASRRTMSTVHVAIRLALAGEPLRVSAPQARRDWIHGHDAARAIFGLLSAPTLGHRVYNLAGDAVTTERLLGAVAAAIPGTTIASVATRDDANVPTPDPAAGSRHLECRRLRDEVGVRPALSVEAGVRDDVAWLAGQAPGWDDGDR